MHRKTLTQRIILITKEMLDSCWCVWAEKESDMVGVRSHIEDMGGKRGSC